MEPRDAHSERVDFLVAQREAAEARFAASRHQTGLFVALSGVQTDADSLTIGRLFTIEKLKHPIVFAGRESTRLLAPRHQLACYSPRVSMDTDWFIDGGLWTLSTLLKIRCGGYFTTCEISDVPWDLADGLPLGHQTKTVALAHSQPNWWPSGAAVNVTADDCEWVGQSFMGALDLRSDARFHFALASYSGSFDEADPRMAASKAWAGIEALIGISTELRFRLSLYVAAVLHPPGAHRLTRYRSLTKMYDRRSKVVHGATLPAADVLENVSGAQEVLGSLLTRAIEGSRLWSPSELEQLLLAP